MRIYSIYAVCFCGRIYSLHTLHFVPENSLKFLLLPYLSQLKSFYIFFCIVLFLYDALNSRIMIFCRNLTLLLALVISSSKTSRSSWAYTDVSALYWIICILYFRQITQINKTIHGTLLDIPLYTFICPCFPLWIREPMPPWLSTFWTFCILILVWCDIYLHSCVFLIDPLRQIWFCYICRIR